MSEIKETKKIQLSTLTKQVEDGMKKDELAAFYGLPMTQMTKVLQQAGLKIRKFHKPAFVLENDLEDSEESTNLQAISSEKTQEVPEIAEAISTDFEISEESTPETLGEAISEGIGSWDTITPASTEEGNVFGGAKAE